MLYLIIEGVQLPILTGPYWEAPSKGWHQQENSYFHHPLVSVVLAVYRKRCPKSTLVWHTLGKGTVFPKRADPIPLAHTYSPPLLILSILSCHFPGWQDQMDTWLMLAALDSLLQGPFFAPIEAHCIWFPTSPKISTCNSVLLVHPYSSTREYPQTYSSRSLKLPHSPPFSSRLEPYTLCCGSLHHRAKPQCLQLKRQPFSNQVNSAL